MANRNIESHSGARSVRLWRGANRAALALTGVALLAAWSANGAGERLASALGWRVAAVGAIALVVLNLGVFRRLIRGTAVFSNAVTESLPFTDEELNTKSDLHPSRVRYRVHGYEALVGIALLVLAAVVWCVGLSCVTPETSGVMTLSQGEATSAVRPDSEEYSFPLSQQFTLTALPSEGRAEVLVEDIVAAEEQAIQLDRGRSVLLPDYRVSFVGSTLGPFRPTLELRFTKRWVFWWRITAFACAAVGAFLLVLVPHRSLAWVGRSGDYRLVLWSINRPRRLTLWAEHVVGELVPPPLREELERLKQHSERQAHREETSRSVVAAAGPAKVTLWGLLAALMVAASLSGVFWEYRALDPRSGYDHLILAAVCIAAAIGAKAPEGRRLVRLGGVAMAALMCALPTTRW